MKEKRRIMRSPRQVLDTVVLTALLTIALTVVGCSSVFASFSVPKTIEQDLPPQSSEFEISTFSFGGMQSRSEVPTFSIPVFVKLLSHQSLNKEILHRAYYRRLYGNGLNVGDVLFSKRLSQDFYTLCVGCLRL